MKHAPPPRHLHPDLQHPQRKCECGQWVWLSHYPQHREYRCPAIDPEAWAGFEEMRKMIRKPMTDRARKLLLTRLDAIHKAGHDANAALDQSTLKNWDSVYEPRGLELTTKASSEAERTQAYLASQTPEESTPERKAQIAEMLRQTQEKLRRVA